VLAAARGARRGHVLSNVVKGNGAEVAPVASEALDHLRVNALNRAFTRGQGLEGIEHKLLRGALGHLLANLLGGLGPSCAST
jgi:hypothetical protein